MIIYILFLNLARFAIARMYSLSASVSLCVAFRRLFFCLHPRAPRTLNEMEASKVVKVSVIIHDKYLDDLKGFVTEKGGSVESSETSDVNAACDPGCSDAVPDAEALVPKEIASKIWFSPRKFCIDHKDRFQITCQRHHQLCQKHMAGQFGKN